MRLLLASVSLVGLSLTLQGCGSSGGSGGGGGGGTTAKPTEPTTVTTTTTGTPKPRTPGLTAAAAAKYLNDLYYGYNETNALAPVGLTMNLPSDRRSFYGNIFCSSYDNPHGRTTCSLGRCDCRFSAAMYNYKMLITEGDTIMDSLSRRVGIVINQSLVETKYGRCFYLWDGATNNKYNVGCGTGAPGTNCNAKGTAFDNICPSTGKVCTAADPESRGGLCHGFGGRHKVPEAHSRGFQCAIPGPAIDFHAQDDWTPADGGYEHLRAMVVERLKYQKGTDEGVPKSTQWNEIVLDTRLMMPDVWEDPALVIPAIAYAKGDEVARNDARAMRDEYCRINQLAAKIPLVAFDLRAVVSKKEPLFLALPEDADELGETVVVV